MTGMRATAFGRLRLTTAGAKWNLWSSVLKRPLPRSVLPIPSFTEVIISSKVIPATVTFVDIAGIVKGASQGEGMGNAFLAGTAGTPNERPSVDYVNILGTGQGLLTRNGAFANDTSGRTVSGATYYGIMEMSGNVWEWTISAAQASGRLYNGTHGDGRLTSGGTHDVATWPDHWGIGFRGGAVSGAASTSLHRVSDRTYGGYRNLPTGMSYEVGGRGVRTIE